MEAILRVFALALLVVAISVSGGLAQVADKPRTREAAETKSANLDRYKQGGFGPNATATIGVEVKFPESTPQGVTVLDFPVDSSSKAAGMQVNDWILEVEGSPVGLIRNRYYELWPFYGRLGDPTTEVLVTYVAADGSRRYYYLPIATQIVSGDACEPLPPDFFTTAKPVTRDGAESRQKNIARYKRDYGNFAKYGKYELGVKVVYSYRSGAEIIQLTPGGAAAAAGLKVGDCIQEAGGAPVGVFGDRTYELWRQYAYDKDGVVEFLVVYTDSSGKRRYYYPEIALNKLTTSG